MPNEYIFVKTIEKPKDKNGKEYTKIIDHLNKQWFLFRSDFTFEVNKCYDLSYELNEKDFPLITKITPLKNLFQEKALREVANKNDITKNLAVATSYAVTLIANGMATLEDLEKVSLRIYEFIQSKSDEFYNATQTQNTKQ
jgi:hypothetical protein